MGALAALIEDYMHRERIRSKAELCRRIGMEPTTLATLIGGRPNVRMPIPKISRLHEGTGIPTLDLVRAYLHDAGLPLHADPVDDETEILTLRAQLRPEQRQAVLDLLRSLTERTGRTTPNG